MFKQSAFRALLIGGMIAVLTACASSRALDDSVSDLTANAELKGVLFTDRNHDYSDVDITIHEGRLLLSGTMQSEEGREQLLANAWKADGVERVIDEILIEPKTTFRQGFIDTRIDQTLRARLLADNDVTSGDYKISVSKSVVYLIGSTRTQAELDEALRLAKTTRGVEKVVHYVTVRMPQGAPAPEQN